MPLNKETKPNLWPDLVGSYSHSMSWPWIAWQSPSLSRSTTGLNSEFSISENSYPAMVNEPNLPYYLPKIGGKIFGCILFLRIFALYEMQIALLKIWNQMSLFPITITYATSTSAFSKYKSTKHTDPWTKTRKKNCAYSNIFPLTRTCEHRSKTFSHFFFFRTCE